jgi:crotonobetainyl-CoA:carnitine CoA-transferase CaiB-like acyl-CoA transferase
MSEVSTDLPLSGVRVLSVEQFGAGPWATLQLADLGADVIKIEDPVHGGDVSRGVPPYRGETTSLFFETFNRGKRSIALDLRIPAGRAAFHDLVKEVDVVFCNLRGDQPERLGLRYEDLRDVNPKIVCCSLTGYGTTGPRAHQGAYDYVIQGLAGWMSITGEPGAPPTKTGLSLVDFSCGYVAATSVLAGLFRAERTGVGCNCDVSLFETALSLLNYVGTWTASRDDYEPRKMGHSAHPSIVPFQAIPTGDGWIVVACPKEKFWIALCEAVGRADLLADERFASFAGRDEHREALLAELYAAFATRGAAEWVTILEAAGVPCGPVNTIREALADPQAVARGATQTIEHPELGSVTHLSSALGVSTGLRPIEIGPGRGEHTAEVLSDVAGYDEAHIAELVGDGVVHLAANGAPAADRRPLTA